MTEILYVVGASGGVLVGLYWLEERGKVQLNHKAIKATVWGVLALIGASFVKELFSFL